MRAGDRALPFLLACYFSLAGGARHIKTTYRAQIHTDATIDTSLFIDLETIGHTDLLCKELLHFLFCSPCFLAVPQHDLIIVGISINEV